MGEPRADQVLLRDVPQAVRDDAAEAIIRHTVPLLEVYDSPDGGRIQRWGTGTLVRVDGMPCVLTAAHVWKGLRPARAIGVGLMEERHRFLVDPARVAPVVTFGPGAERALGPDLTLLALPDEAIERIEAHKVFLDVSKRRESMLDDPIDLDVGMWGVAGAPLAASKTTPQEATMYMGPYFSGVEAVAEREGFDYFDIGVNYATNPDAPASFAGVSGGGLWRVLLVPAAGGTVSWDGKPRLEGVAFFETEVVADRRYIRCHGTKSVYKRILDAMGSG